MKASEITEQIDALGRPFPEFVNWRQPGGPLAKVKAWETENPDKALKYKELFELREKLEAAENFERLATKNTESSERKLSKLGIDRALVALQDLKETESIKTARNWLMGDKSWLLLVGPVGCGKSVAAAYLLRQTAIRGGSVGFIRASDLTQTQIDGNIRRLERAEMLVIDDIGVEHASDFGRSVLGQLCDARHQLIDVRTVVTTNLTREDLEKRVGERIIDRWRESSVMVRATGQSLRRQNT